MQPAVRAYYQLEDLWTMRHLPPNAAGESK
jgi:hypothetical protein